MDISTLPLQFSIQSSCVSCTWWHHAMETCSTLQDPLWENHSLFDSTDKGKVMWSFGIFLYVLLNKHTHVTPLRCNLIFQGLHTVTATANIAHLGNSASLFSFNQIRVISTSYYKFARTSIFMVNSVVLEKHKIVSVPNVTKRGNV